MLNQDKFLQSLIKLYKAKERDKIRLQNKNIKSCDDHATLCAIVNQLLILDIVIGNYYEYGGEE